jgi:ribonuclease VapC
MALLIDGLGFDIVSVTPASAERVARSYGRWGKGVHPAGLNFGDCFSYDVAMANACRVLFIGSDFAKSDVMSVL